MEILLKYTDPTGYQTAAAPGAISWLGGGGGWGERGMGFGGSVNWDYFANMNMYTNWQGRQVSYMDTPVNIAPGPEGVTVTGQAAISLYNNMAYGGFQISVVQAFGKTYLVSAFGPLGTLETEDNGGISFSNPTAAAYVGEVGIVGKGESGGGRIDWGGVANSSLGLFGGAAEMFFGGAGEYFSAGIATDVSVPLIADGGVRFLSNGARLISYFTGHNLCGNVIPGNTGAWIGKGIDMAAEKSFYDYGYGQAFGGFANDFGSFVFTGGTAETMSRMMNNYNTVNTMLYFNIYVGYSNSMFYDMYPLKNK